MSGAFYLCHSFKNGGIYIEDLNNKELVSDITNDDILKFALEQGIINLEDVQEKIAMKEKEKLLAMHPYEIWEGKNGNWYTYISNNEEKGRILKKRKTKNSIEDFLVNYYKEKQSNELCFREVCTQWLKEREKFEEIEKNSLTRYESDFKRFFPPDEPFCKIKMCDINDSDLEKFIKRTIKKHKLTLKTYGGLRILIIGTFKYAKREKYTKFSIVNFFDDFVLSAKIFEKKINKKSQVFRVDEMKSLITYLCTHQNPIYLGILLQFLTGIRVGELAGLEKSDNYKFRTLSIHNTECTYYDKELKKRITYVKPYPKTEEGIRDIILPTSAQMIIDIAKKNNPNGKYLFMIDGKRISERMFNYHLQKACRAIGIEERSTHKIRKTYASLLLANKVDESIVLNQLGHKQISTTQTYYHYDISMDDNKMQVLDNVMELPSLPALYSL